MTDKINEQQAYDEYVKDCHSDPTKFVSEFSFLEWRAVGRPKGLDKAKGNWPTPWPNEVENGKA